tara:strand:+ start:1514 stop:1834 length:321 start_codon:yes stop_codon:yes gene_type:complete
MVKKIKKEFDIVSQRVANFVSTREDILSQNQFVKLSEVEDRILDAVKELDSLWVSLEKYRMNYDQIKKEVVKCKQRMLAIDSEVKELKDWSTNLIQNHLTKTMRGE